MAVVKECPVCGGILVFCVCDGDKDCSPDSVCTYCSVKKKVICKTGKVVDYRLEDIPVLDEPDKPFGRLTVPDRQIVTDVINKFCELINCEGISDYRNYDEWLRELRRACSRIINRLEGCSWRLIRE